MDEFIKNLRLAQELNNDIKNHGLHENEQNSGDIVFDFLISDNELRWETRNLYLNGHYTQAIEESCKLLERIVREKANLMDADFFGKKLMDKVFSANNPIILLNTGTTQSEKDEREGYRSILSGFMQGIRNPRAHASGKNDSKYEAIKIIAFIDFLISLIRAGNSKHS